MFHKNMSPQEDTDRHKARALHRLVYSVIAAEHTGHVAKMIRIRKLWQDRHSGPHSKTAEMIIIRAVQKHANNGPCFVLVSPATR